MRQSKLISRRFCILTLAVATLAMASVRLTPRAQAQPPIAPPPNEFNILYTVNQDDELLWHRHDIAFATGAATKHTLMPPKSVGKGWSTGIRNVLPGGTTTIYAIERSGSVSWYKHIGGAVEGTTNIQGPINVTAGWQGFRHVVAMGHGVFYGVRDDGIVVWLKHNSYQNPKGKDIKGEWASAVVMNTTNGVRNFLAFKRFFCGGNGVIYAVGYDGNLYWLRHNAYLNPLPAPVGILGANPLTIQQDLQKKAAWIASWQGPIKIAEGWGEFTQLFSPGEGHIYGVLPNGDLMYYRHTGWRTGSYISDEASMRKIAEGWDKYRFAFARNITSDLGSGDRDVDVVVH